MCELLQMLREPWSRNQHERRRASLDRSPKYPLKYRWRRMDRRYIR